MWIVCRSMNRMRGGIEESKEISPMFPRLHVKDAEKGGPKAPPRNKMALYEQFSIPSQSFAPASASLFPLPLRNYTAHTSSSHIGSNQSIQFNSNAPSILAEKSQAFNFRRSNLTKYTQDNFINSKNSLKALDGEDVFITAGSAHGKSSCCSIIQNNKDEDGCNLSCSLKNLNSFRKKVNSPGVVDLKSAQYGKIQMEELTKVSQNGQKPEEVLSLDGFGDMTDASLISLVQGRDSKSMNKEHRSLKDEIRNISVDSLKTLQGSSVHTHEEHAAFGDKFNSRDHHIEKPAASDVHRCSGELEIGRRFFLDKGAGNEDEETSVMHISPDNVVGAIGEQQFWKARRTIVNQQKIFVMQVFELHRLIKVQRLIAGSPHILLADNLLLNKPPPKTSTTKKFQSDFAGEKPSSVAKLDSKSVKAPTAEHATNSAVEKIPIPCVNNITKGHANQLPNYGHHLANLPIASSDTNSKQSPSYVYPPPGNQWLVPVMSPSEGLVYKPVIGPCPPNAGFMAPIYGTCGSVSFNPLSKDASSEAALAPSSHQKFGILSGSSLPQFLPPPFIHNPSSMSASAVEQMGQSNGPENHNSCGEVNSAILYQSSSNISSPTSQVMSRNISIHQSPKDKEPHRSTASSPSKRTSAGEVLPLFPLAPTCWQSEDRHTQVELQPRVIKAMPHNPKSASESAARIFRSIQEERKHL
ncbi:Protein HEADING DATE 3B ELF3-like protein [Vigna angularis]|uniref:Protein HEADING DATE 3B ELF3-like protein n=1 Tax=Phaseolus angularis TaxID=3914 RepID=A0A8T0JPS5_PHAAN|nr:ELF3-like protein 2 isoform X1 [Vigna angularis]XP_052724556.1 ELF3-like protein 2 isoform X1 [Vigna angularis]XP_052724558.1 ELF3-like protein 2 isoform X1 [Vigna angularis]KAG2379900.1 Protein HEADING DATE 3B ELF3-like protein [Vigna angularis]